MTDTEAVLALNAIAGLGARRLRQLIEFYQSPQHVLKASYQDLMATGFLTEPHALSVVQFPVDEFLTKEIPAIEQKGIEIITFQDKAYPSALSEIPDAPICLYVKGKSEALSALSVGIVGSRHAGLSGKKAAKDFARVLAQAGICIVSGIARGIDTSAHQGCLEGGGMTIGVIGCGLNIIYPKENARLYESISAQGAIISEYPMETPPLTFNFPWRNRIISGLSKAVLVIEASQKSGALITASYAAQQGRDVLAVPSNIDNPVAVGSNELIRDGAQVALNPQDVLDSLGMQLINLKQGLTEAQNQVNLAPDSLVALNVIGSDKIHIDQLLRDNRLTPPQWRTALLDLELGGIIVQVPGQYYMKV